VLNFIDFGNTNRPPDRCAMALLFHVPVEID
jgi:hypothetical protein